MTGNVCPHIAFFNGRRKLQEGEKRSFKQLRSKAYALKINTATLNLESLYEELVQQFCREQKILDDDYRTKYNMYSFI